MQNRWDDATLAHDAPPFSALFSAAGRATFLFDVTLWCAAQARASLVWRGVLWLYLFSAGLKLVFKPATGDLFSLITLAIHEIGHFVFAMLGEWIGIAGGSLAQILVPLYALSLFWRQRDWLALGVGGYWLASSLFNLSVYIGDARTQELELVSPFALGEEPIHDWNYLLSHAHILPFDSALSWLVRFIATLLLIASLTWSVWVMWRIARQ